MLGMVSLAPKRLEEYRDIVGDAVIAELRELARPLRGLRVLHVNATAYGGGVAELLTALVPLMRDVGLNAEWQVIRGADEFFQVTKAMHNGLQGMPFPWSPDMWEHWLRYNLINAELFDETYDVVIIHDPQPAALAQLVGDRNGGRLGKWIWRCHIDLTDARPEVWDRLRPFVACYDGAIFTLHDYVKPDLHGPRVYTIPPAIDPLSTKNTPLPLDEVTAVLRRYRVDPERPLMVQVSRFDPWKDPLGVIAAYRLVRREVPDLQLVLVASMAHDDPEGWEFYERTARHAGEDWDIHLLSNLNGVGNREVNAFQQAAQVVVQKSLREGFGLVVTEGLWKGRPVVAGNVGGIPLQVQHRRTGFLVNSVEDCAEHVLCLLQHPELAGEMGAAGREHVRQNFLITRYLRDYLRLFRTLDECEPSPQHLGVAASVAHPTAGGEGYEQSLSAHPGRRSG
ncbi:MAG: glycosyltransferase [Chloroflexi bacterium]|nr:glycosyltransferase [Chloroflexota bacterium]